MSRKEDAHLIIQDVIRVARECGNNNLKRDDYLEWPTHAFSKDTIRMAFGSWTTMMQATGLRYDSGKPTPEQRKHNLELDKFGFKETVSDKFDREIKPYHGKFDRLLRDIFIALVLSDGHSQFLDLFTWDVYLDTARQVQPDLCVLGGDMLEFYRISRHNQNPTRAMSMQSEIDFVVERLKELRLACPKAQIDFHIGNHEARLFTYLCEKSPALASMRCLQFDKLLELEALEINLVGRKNFVFRTNMADNFKVYRNLWAWTHGTDCTVFPANKELARYGISGASGHVHRHTYFAKRDVHGFKSWVSLGMAATKEVMEEYQHTIISAERGFLLAYVHPKGVTQQHISTENGMACVGGTFYTEKPKKD